MSVTKLRWEGDNLPSHLARFLLAHSTSLKDFQLSLDLLTPEIFCKLTDDDDDNDDNDDDDRLLQFLSKKFIAGNSVTSGQSYKHFTIINYNSKIVITSKLLILTTLEL